jgi:hypothetical protein
VARHPGWYEGSEFPQARLEAEADSVVRATKGKTFFVLSPPTRAGRALLGPLVAAGGIRVAAAGVFEVWTIGAGGRAADGPHGMGGRP